MFGIQNIINVFNFLIPIVIKVEALLSASAGAEKKAKAIELIKLLMADLKITLPLPASMLDVFLGLMVDIIVMIFNNNSFFAKSSATSPK